MTTDRLPVWRTKKYADLTLSGVTGDGVFSGYASLFDEVDLGKDAIQPGAFPHMPGSDFAYGYADGDTVHDGRALYE